MPNQEDQLVRREKITEMIDSADNKDVKKNIDTTNNFVVLKTIGKKLNGVFTFEYNKSFIENPQKFLFQCGRVRWLLICLENHLALMNTMSDSLGVRILDMVVRNPLELLIFEFDNFSKIANSGKPMKNTGLRAPYIGARNDMVSFYVEPLMDTQMDLAKVMGTDEKEEIERLQLINKHRLITGTEPDVHRNIKINRYFNHTESLSWPCPVGMETHMYAVWIGPCTSGKYRQYRLDLSNLYTTLVTKHIPEDNVLPLTKYLLYQIKSSSYDSMQQHRELFASVTPSNAPFLLASLLSPYQSIERFLNENLESFEPWSRELYLRNFTIPYGETRIVRMGKCDNLFQIPDTEGYIERRKQEVNSWICDVETSIHAQYALILQLKSFIVFKKANNLNGLIIKVFNETTRRAFAISQLIENMLKHYSDVSAVTLNLFAEAIDCSKQVNKGVDECFSNTCYTSAPIGVRIAYLDLFVHRCNRLAGENSLLTEKYRKICTVVRKNGLYIKEQYFRIPEQHRMAVLERVTSTP